jgi:uncharacterized membrane protein HdeD (DUF308 family)
MRLALAANWWAMVLRGLAGIAFGIMAFAWPGITLFALVFLFAGYCLVDGIFNIVAAVRAMGQHERWGILVLEGLVGVAAAVITVTWPAITTFALVYVIAAWAVVTGVLEIAAAVRLRRVITGEWLLILSGVLSLIFGFLLVASPLAGALVISWWVGAYAFIFGVTMVALGFRLRSWEHNPTAGHIPAPAH